MIEPQANLGLSAMPTSHMCESVRLMPLGTFPQKNWFWEKFPDLVSNNQGLSIIIWGRILIIKIIIFIISPESPHYI